MKIALVQKSSRLLSAAAAAFLIAIPLAQAGNESGHGGVSIVCRDSRQRILSVELLDTFEGRYQYGLSITDRDIPTLEQVDLAALQLSIRKDLQDEFKKTFDQIWANSRFVEYGVGLNPTNDAFPVINKRGCAYEQLAVYSFDGQVLVDKELYNWMSYTDRAALWVHESIYKMARTRGASSSITSRKITAYLFAQPSYPRELAKLLDVILPPRPLTPAEMPRALKHLTEGRYLPLQGDLDLLPCEVQLFKDLQHGKLVFLYVGDANGICKETGLARQMECDKWNCYADLGTTADGDKLSVQVSPYKPGHFTYSVWKDGQMQGMVYFGLK